MRRVLTYILLLCTLPAMAWKWWPLPMDQGDLSKDTLTYSVGLSTVLSSGEFAPFWMHSNQHGAVSSSPFSGSLRLVLDKPATRPGRWWDYDFAADVSGMAFSPTAGNPLNSTLRRFPYLQGEKCGLVVNRLYAHLRLYIIDITAGVVPIAGCNPEVNASLSAGDFLFSGNAPSIPRITVGIDHYTPVPGLFGYLEIRGGITHAWFTDDIYVRGGKIHYKFIGGRAGGDLPVNVTYELHHVAQWGGYSPVYGDLGNNLSSFMTVFLGKAGGTMFNDIYNAQGNHLTSQLMSLIVKGDGWRVSGSWQTLIEDNFVYMGAGKNNADGIWSVRAEQTRWPYIRGVEIEYIGTSDQSGPYHDQDGIIFSGQDNYYRNGVYVNGWNYGLRTLGTPFITSPLYNTDGTIYTLNSRAKIMHLGLNGDIYGFQYRAMTSFVRNYHEYDSGKDFYAESSRNFAWLFEVNKYVPQAWGLTFGLRVAGDIGTQFGNNGGVMLSVSKQGVVWNSKK